MAHPKPALSVTRFADRAEMARQLQSLVLRCGATFVRSSGGEHLGPRCIQLAITAPGGLEVSVALNPERRDPNTFVLSWHMGLDSTGKLNNATFGGDVNPYHHRKATYLAHGMADLCEKLERGLTMAADGSAYISGSVASCELAAA